MLVISGLFWIVKKGVKMGNQKRRDKKNRILLPGEAQRSDGRYMYRYTDVTGKRKTEYSWRLVQTDPHPKGKKKDISLREKEELIKRDTQEFISYTAGKMTLNELFDLYMSVKKLNADTEINYNQMWNKNVRERTIPNSVEIKMLRKYHFVEMYREMQEDECGNGTIILIGKIINALLNFACEEDYIRKNYAVGIVRSLKIFSQERFSLTLEEQYNFMKFILTHKTYKKFYWMFLFMIETMCRASELAGVTLDDIDVKEKVWDLNHQLKYKNCNFFIAKPKTRKSERIIPLSQDAVRAVISQKQILMKEGKLENYKVDGYKNFLFLDSKNNLMTVNKIDYWLKKIVEDYNKEEMDKAEIEKRKAQLLPNITSHILRHTGCTRAAERGMDIRVLQDIMGHNNIKTTMKVYNHVDDARLQREMERLDALRLSEMA